MKYLKMSLLSVLVIAFVFTFIPVISESTYVEAAEETCQITAPENDSLVAAGYIDIKWNAATAKTVKNYDVFINGKKHITTTDTTYEYYTTEVAYHYVYIQVNYQDGTVAQTDKVKFGVSKKGLAVSGKMGTKISPKSFRVTWYYNWGEKPSTNEYYDGTEYVPMVWKSTSADNFYNRVMTHKSNGYKYVLTFNEPDLEGQCDMEVDAVYTVWKGISSVSGIKISSPVTALWPKISTAWFQPFMDKLQAGVDHDVDFISLHCYPENAQGAGMAEFFLRDVVDWTWEKYHKPIWITEFSTHGNYVTANGTKEFWEAVMPELDKRDYVERYSVFAFDAGSNPGYGMWNYSTGVPTEAGIVYARNGNPTKDAKQYNEEDETTTTSAPTTKKIAKPAKPVILSASKKKSAKKAIIKIKKTTGAKGYQIRYCDSKSFQGYSTKNSRSLKVRIKGLDRNTTYYVKVRAYNYNAKGKKQFGKWSRRKKIKMKK